MLTFARGDYATAAAIMTEAANWLIGKGQQLWPLEEVSEQALRDRCVPESVVVGYFESYSVVAALLEWEDATFWPGVADAAFIHRLAVRRSAAGQGHAKALLDWALDEAAKAGKRSLKLDCDSDRTNLQEFYEACGFERVGSWVLKPHYDQTLYSRPVAQTQA